MNLKIVGTTPSGGHAMRIEGMPGVQKNIPGLKPRSGAAPIYARSGPRLADTGPIQAGERVTVYVDSEGARAPSGFRIRVESVHADGFLFGRIEHLICGVLTKEINGIERGDHVQIPSPDFVWVIERASRRAVSA